MMYGWIPKTSYSNLEEVYFDGTRDHGLWGGNINVCREVYQNEDGTLSTRLDSKVEELLNRGKMYYKKEVSANTNIPGEYNRTYVTFDVDMNGSNEFSYKMKSDGKDYEIALYKDGNDVYMSISCAQDKGHKVASSQYIGNALKDTYQVQIIVDHSIVEFFVDKKYSLTARTSMFKGVHTISLASDGNATFKNFAINKLANQDDIYD